MNNLTKILIGTFSLIFIAIVFLGVTLISEVSEITSSDENQEPVQSTPAKISINIPPPSNVTADSEQEVT